MRYRNPPVVSCIKQRRGDKRSPPPSPPCRGIKARQREVALRSSPYLPPIPPSSESAITSRWSGRLWERGLVLGVGTKVRRTGLLVLLDPIIHPRLIPHSGISSGCHEAGRNHLFRSPPPSCERVSIPRSEPARRVLVTPQPLDPPDRTSQAISLRYQPSIPRAHREGAGASGGAITPTPLSGRLSNACARFVGAQGRVPLSSCSRIPKNLFCE